MDKCGEMLGSRLNTIHNLYFYQEFMQRIREAIENDQLDEFAVAYYQRIESAKK